MVKKKKAWNNTNPLYRYLHSKKSSRKTKRAKASRRSLSMVRHRRSSHRSGGSSGMKGLLESFFIGAGAATISEKIVPQVIPFQSAVIGGGATFLIKKGGWKSAAAGAAGALARDYLKVSTGGIAIGSSVTGY